MTEDYELKDDVHRQQYEFRIGNYTPKIEYIKSINGEIYLTHTEVPRELEGKGIGSQLVEKTLQDIERTSTRSALSFRGSLYQETPRMETHRDERH